MNKPLARRLQRVKIAPEVTLSDADASEFVDKMIAHLHQRALQNKATLAKFKNANNPTLGNPIAQKRWFKRAVAATSGGLITSELTTGTRGRYRADFVDWMVMNPDCRPYSPDTRAPWLVAVLSYTDNTARQGEMGAYPLAAITKHALIRAVQRARVSEPEEFLTLLKSFWKRIEYIVACSQTTRENRDGIIVEIDLDIPKAGFPVPISGMDGSRLIAIVERSDDAVYVKKGDDRAVRYAVITTIIDSASARTSLAREIFDALETFLDRGTREVWENIKVLFREATKEGF